MSRIALYVWNDETKDPRVIELKCSSTLGEVFRIRQEILASDGIIMYEWDVSKNKDYLLGLPEFERKRAEKSEVRPLIEYIGIIWHCIKCKKSSKWPDCVPGRDKCEHELVIKNIQPWEEGR